MIKSHIFSEYAILKLNSTIPLVYILNLNHNDKNNFTLGRSNDCDIVVSDLSVSRKHCSLVYDRLKKKLSIFDLKSKFGTAVELTKERNVEIENF